MSKGQVDPKSKPYESYLGWQCRDLLTIRYNVPNQDACSGWWKLGKAICTDPFNGTYSSTRDFGHLQLYYLRQLAIGSHPILDSCIALTCLLLLPIYYWHSCTDWHDIIENRIFDTWLFSLYMASQISHQPIAGGTKSRQAYLNAKHICLVFIAPCFGNFMVDCSTCPNWKWCPLKEQAKREMEYICKSYRRQNILFYQKGTEKLGLCAFYEAASTYNIFLLRYGEYSFQSLSVHRTSLNHELS